MTQKSYTFGPVPSRRLGRSLGVDLVPFKTCTYDCVYCQLGKTTIKTLKRKEYIPVASILKDVEERLGRTSPTDYITLAGSGEPTLYSRIGDIISGIKKISDIPVAILTNGSLLWTDEVCEDILEADLVMPSLDAGSEKTFFMVNRPHDGIDFEKMIRGLCSFRKYFKGSIWLEIFITAGITDSKDEISKIKELAHRIAPEKIQLNTAIRKAAEEDIEEVSREKMIRISEYIGHDCEVIADYKGVHSGSEFSATRDDVLSLLRLRPCSVDDISSGLEIHRNETVKYLQEMSDKKLITIYKQRGKCFYYASRVTKK